MALKIRENKKLAVIAAVFAVGLLVLLLVLGGRELITGGKGLGEEDRIVVRDEKGELTVFRDGRVEYVTKDGVFYDKWGIGKTDAFFDYFEGRYWGMGEVVGEGEAGSVTIYKSGESYTTEVDEDDELAGVVIDEVGGGGGGDDGDSGGDDGDVGDYFERATPTPTPRTTPRPGVPTPTATPKSGGVYENCLYWRLSYCVIPKPSPTPVPPVSEEEAVIEAKGCEEWNEQSSGQTIIDNTICIPE